MFGPPAGPKQWILAGIAIAAVSAGIFGTGFGMGMAHESDAAAKKVQLVKDQAHAKELAQQRALQAADDSYRKQERSYEQQVSTIRSQYEAQLAAQQAHDARTIADLRGGARRLRLAVSSCSRTAPSTGGKVADSAAPGIAGTATAELAPETAATLWSIAAAGDRAIKQLTALQRWAEQAVKLCNASQGETK